MIMVRVRVTMPIIWRIYTTVREMYIVSETQSVLVMVFICLCMYHAIKTSIVYITLIPPEIEAVASTKVLNVRPPTKTPTHTPRTSPERKFATATRFFSKKRTTLPITPYRAILGLVRTYPHNLVAYTNLRIIMRVYEIYIQKTNEPL